MIWYAGNLSPSTTKDEVRELFEEHGTVMSCIVPSLNGTQRGIDPPPRANDTGRFVLVTMPAVSDVEKAKADSARKNLDGTVLDGYICLASTRGNHTARWQFEPHDHGTGPTRTI